GLVFVFAKIFNYAVGTIGLARRADVAPVQEQPVVRVFAVRRGRIGEKRLLNFARRLPRSKTRAIRDAKNMRVDGDRRLAKYHVENNVRRLAADSGKRFESRTVVGDLAAVFLK